MAPINTPRRAIDAEDAAQILRGYKERLERIEEASAESRDVVQLYRNIGSPVICSDQVSMTENQNVGCDWGTSTWGYSQWDESS